MDMRAKDQVTNERRLGELKNAQISNTDPFQLFTVLSQAAQSMTIAPSEMKGGGTGGGNTTIKSKSSKDAQSKSALASNSNKFQSIKPDELTLGGKRSQITLNLSSRQNERNENLGSSQSRNKTQEKFIGAWSQSQERNLESTGNVG